MKLKTCWLGHRCEILRRLFRKYRSWLWRQFTQICNFWNLAPIKISLRRTTPKTALSRSILRMEIVDWDVEWRNVAGCFWQKWRLSWEKNQHCNHFSANSIHKASNTRTSIEDMFVEGCFASRKRSGEPSKKGYSPEFRSKNYFDCQGWSYLNAVLPNFGQRMFLLERPNKKRFFIDHFLWIDKIRVSRSWMTIGW